MSYHTMYALDWKPQPDAQLKTCEHDVPEGANFCAICGKPQAYADPIEHWISTEQAKNDEFCYAITPDGTSADSCKWYDWAVDMRKLSCTFPDTLFTLRGDGEEPGDIWVAYFQGGKYQEENAVISFAPFDPTKLK